MIIIGAGMAGLLAANMLRRYHPCVIEQQASLPNNHSAVLRFRTSTVGDVLNIPFKKVSMIKSVLPWRNPVADALAYSAKNGGIYRSDRSIGNGNVNAERYIAPPDFIERMAEMVDIDFGRNAEWNGDLTISTIPMPMLMVNLHYPDIPKFQYIEGTNITAVIDNCEAYASLLIPDPAHPFSRISITGDELIIECPQRGWLPSEAEAVAHAAVKLLGIDPLRISSIALQHQHYAKINPIDNDARKQFIFWATDKHNIFSLGRYATWRPGLLLDDLVQDVRLIERWIKDRYNMSQHRSR
jgi:hypothetical protein